MDLKDNKPYFRHFVVELECSFKEANSLDWIKTKIASLINNLDIRVLKSVEHLFQPQGIATLYIISSSHMAVHTWPENNYIHIELLTCSRNKKLDDLDLVIKEIFPGSTYKITELIY